ncbi:Phosphatidylserine decarboxylase [Purpureocillium takamizusanense]|uniref:Phosphatidylserine decarboxylase n=1 Tax=Purpureocillium takamizusanense TaxID=2060973 RepID=A0A9Q8VAT4_9HYPO|nr:Phosphatidylserine decarboxylase [Purpureocillium takamizusanense]UNI19023.1 Phosphatidylserine decarboxylase [Purpureocillium takamizusanense]
MTVQQLSPLLYRSALRVSGLPPDGAPKLGPWLRGFIKDVDGRANFSLDPIVQELKDLIESKAEIRMLASAMLDEIPVKDPYKRNPSEHKHIRDYQHLLSLVSVIMNEVAPAWNMTKDHMAIIGEPFNILLDWPMNTPSGYAFFLRDDVNAKLKTILDTWRERVLKTTKSQYVLTTASGGWLCNAALRVIEEDANISVVPWASFQAMFACEPERDPVYWGYATWDDFFTRKFRDIDRFRPVSHPSDPAWVVHACESMPLALTMNVKKYDKFWMKGQNYSVAEMLDHHELADQFVGGTVHQSILSSTQYHRWSSPVEGDVVFAKVIQGKYFAKTQTTGLDGQGPDNIHQHEVYCSHIATRAILFIQAPEPIGLMCLIALGAADVSTCEITAKFSTGLPKPVAKGEELGMFHYGGSSCCLLFRKGVQLAWVPGAIPGNGKKNQPIRGELALAYKS